MAKLKELSFEQRMSRLQEVVSSLEAGSLPLEKSVELYKEGLELSKSCREQLHKAKLEVSLLTQDGKFESQDLKQDMQDE